MIELVMATHPALDPPIPLTWRRVKRGGGQRADGSLIPELPDTASVVCSRSHDGLIDEHEIAADGTVTPSVVCNQDGCDFHEHIRLIGWDYPR